MFSALKSVHVCMSDVGYVIPNKAYTVLWHTAETHISKYIHLYIVEKLHPDTILVITQLFVLDRYRTQHLCLRSLNHYTTSHLRQYNMTNDK